MVAVSISCCGYLRKKSRKAWALGGNLTEFKKGVFLPSGKNHIQAQFYGESHVRIMLCLAEARHAGRRPRTQRAVSRLQHQDCYVTCGSKVAAQGPLDRICSRFWGQIRLPMRKIESYHSMTNAFHTYRFWPARGIRDLHTWH